MAITQTVIENAYAAYTGWNAPPQILSDGSLAIVVRKVNGSNWDHEIYWSADAGATWTQKLTILTNVSAYYICTWVGDKCYIGYGPETANVALLFYRVDYNTVGQSFSLAVNGTTIKTAVSGEWYGRASFDIEPGGRLWCGFLHTTTAYYPRAYYSDDGGTTWNSTTFGAGLNSEAVGAMPELHCLKFNTVFLWPRYQSSAASVLFYSHLHTDSVNTWTNHGSIIGATYAAGNPPDSHSAKVVESPSKHVIGVLSDRSSPQKLTGWMVIEDGSGGLTTANSSDSVTLPSTETPWAFPSGRTDGVMVYYVFSGSPATIRRRTLAPTGGAWGSESTVVSSPANFSIYWFGAIAGIAAAVATAEHFVLMTTDTTHTPYVLREGLPSLTLPSVGIIVDLPIEILGMLQLVSTQPVESLGTLSAVADLQVEWEGLWLAIADTLTVMVPLDQSFLDTLTIVAAATLADFIDRLTVQSSIGGGDFMDSLRILPAGLVALHSDDVQQPYALVTRD